MLYYIEKEFILYFFTADEHYHHNNILRYCGRPFYDIEEHDVEIIKKHNSVVRPGDTVVHAGDFTLISNRAKVQNDYINRLNGTHIFLKGSHDRWLHSQSCRIWEKTIEGQFIVVCHYSMRTWHRSHYNSWQLYAHSHGKLAPQGKQHDIGVDNNNFYPLSFDEICVIMQSRPDNFNLVKR